MKQTILTMLFAFLAITGSVKSQNATLSANTVAVGGSIQVTITGLTPGQQYEVQLIGIDEDGDMSENGTRTITADANGKYILTEVIEWPKNNEYATSLGYRPVGGNGHWSNLSPGNLSVTP